VAQFQNNAPEYLPLSEDFWKDLLALPSTYDLSAYQFFIQRYGTHYMEEGSLGGQYRALLELDADYMMQMSMLIFPFLCQHLIVIFKGINYMRKGLNCARMIFNNLQSK